MEKIVMILIGKRSSQEQTHWLWYLWLLKKIKIQEMRRERIFIYCFLEDSSIYMWGLLELKHSNQCQAHKH